MPNYPTADPSFTTKNTNDTIENTHVNGLQDEVVAIGAALRGTLSHGVTVGSTYSLNVGGNSTFSGAAVFSSGVTVSSGGVTVSTGNVTLGQNLNVAGTSTFTGAITGKFARAGAVLLSMSTNQDLGGAAAWVGVSWNTETSDVSGMHSTASNSSRITFADSTGLYQVGASINFAANSSGTRMARLMFNDTTPMGGNGYQGTGNPGALSLPITIGELVVVSDTTDFVTVQGWQNTGSTLSVVPGSTSFAAKFWAFRVSL